MKRAAARGVGNRNLASVMRAVRDFCRTADAPISAFIAETARDPYRVLTGCILSLRTRDRVTAAAAARLFAIARILQRDFAGRVPDDIDALLALPGVGRKTANLVVTVAYALPGICVDTHVHRISNRWGYVKTREPNDTERVLRERLPRRYWLEINPLLVTFGQTVCRPVTPHCEVCPVERWCARVGMREKVPGRRRLTSA